MTLAGWMPRMNVRTAVSWKVGRTMGLVGPMYIFEFDKGLVSWYLDA